MNEATGNVKYSAPIGKHDDAVCSLGLAVWELRDLKNSPALPKEIIDTTPEEFKQRKFRKPTR